MIALNACSGANAAMERLLKATAILGFGLTALVVVSALVFLIH